MENGKGSEGSHSNGATPSEKLSDAEQLLHLYNHSTRMCYVEGMRKVLKTLTLYVGRMEGPNRTLLLQGMDQVEKEIAETEASVQAGLNTPPFPAAKTP